MKYRILSQTDKQMFGANVAAMVEASDLVALGAVATGSVVIAPLSGNLAVGNKIQLVGMVLNTVFAGSDTPTTCAVTVGDAGSAARYLASTELLGTGSYVLYSAGTGTAFALTTAGTITAAFTNTAKLMSNITAGQVTFYLRIDDLTSFAIPGQ